MSEKNGELAEPCDESKLVSDLDLVIKEREVKASGDQPQRFAVGEMNVGVGIRQRDGFRANETLVVKNESLGL